MVFGNTNQGKKEPQFMPNEKLASMKPQDWQELTEDIFKELFRKSAVKRTKFAGLQRNISFVSEEKE